MGHYRAQVCAIDHQALKHDAELRAKHGYGIGEMLGMVLFNCRFCHTTLSVSAKREAA